MNEANSNYASLEASKRLVDAGIVLETERYFHIFDEEVHDYTAEQKKIWEGEVRRGNASPEAIFIPRPFNGRGLEGASSARMVFNS